MTETYLVEIIYKTDRGAGRLERHFVEAGSNSHAWNMVTVFHSDRKWQVIDGFVTCDPYKVAMAQRAERN